MPDAYSTRLDDAILLACQAFRPIHRKATAVPYLTHLLAVCALVGEHGGDEDQMVAAVLHDYLEDIEGSTREALADQFGERVASLVVGLSDHTVRPKPPWRERKEAYLAQLAAKPPDLKLISAADKLHNCRSIVRDHRAQGDAVFQRFRGRKAGTIWYYRQLVVELGKGWKHPLLDELAVAVRELEDLAAPML